MRVVTREIILWRDLLQVTKTRVPAHVELWGNAFPADITQRTGVIVAGTLEGLPIVVRPDGRTHFLHLGLMKFQGRLQNSGFVENSGDLAIEKVIENLSKWGLQQCRGLGKTKRGHGMPQVGVCSVGYARQESFEVIDVDFVFKAA